MDHKVTPIYWMKNVMGANKTPGLCLYFNSRVYLKLWTGWFLIFPDQASHSGISRWRFLVRVACAVCHFLFPAICFHGEAVNSRRCSEAWRRIPDPEADKPGLDSAYEGGPYMRGSLGAAVISPPVLPPPPCTGPGPGRGRPALSPVTLLWFRQFDRKEWAAIRSLWSRCGAAAAIATTNTTTESTGGLIEQIPAGSHRF